MTAVINSAAFARPTKLGTTVCIRYIPAVLLIDNRGDLHAVCMGGRADDDDDATILYSLRAASKSENDSCYARTCDVRTNIRKYYFKYAPRW